MATASTTRDGSTPVSEARSLADAPLLSRRRIFGWACGALAAAVAGCTRRESRQAAGAEWDALVSTLEAVLETLYPEGEFPGFRATELPSLLIEDLGLELLGSGARIRVADTFFQLDARARARESVAFRELTPPVREEVLVSLLPPHQDHAGMRLIDSAAAKLYYSHPVVWDSLGFRHPPQPAGYLDFARPPRDLRA